MAGALEISREDWVKEQSADEDIGPVVELVNQGKHLQYTCKEEDPPGMQVLLKSKQNLLYHKVKLKNHNSIINQFILPKTQMESHLSFA